MAKNIGLIQFTGKLGDLVGYTRNGQLIIQRKGGFDGERLKTEERYESVRKRQSEFGKCAKISSAIRQALVPWLQYVPNRLVYNHIQSVVMAVKNCDVASEKGAKTFEKGLKTVDGTALFRKFQLNSKRSLSSGTQVLDLFDWTTGRVAVQPSNYKLLPKQMVWTQLVVVHLDLTTYEWQVTESAVQYCPVLRTRLDLEVALPDKEGLSVVFLFVGKVAYEGTYEIKYRDAETGFGVLDFKWHDTTTNQME